MHIRTRTRREHQKNYVDHANAPDQEQSARREAALKIMRSFPDRAVVFKGFSTNGAASIPDYFLDFVYIDARHDFCGAHNAWRARRWT